MVSNTTYNSIDCTEATPTNYTGTWTTSYTVYVYKQRDTSYDVTYTTNISRDEELKKNKTFIKERSHHKDETGVELFF